MAVRRYGGSDVIPSPFALLRAGSARDRLGVRSHAMFVYILASKTLRLYVGVTNDLVRRAWEHRTGAVPGFTRRYGIHRLVYFEMIVGPAEAIAREKQIKGWLRCKKIALIEARNPGWADLSDEWLTTRDSADPSLRSG